MYMCKEILVLRIERAERERVREREGGREREIERDKTVQLNKLPINLI